MNKIEKIMASFLSILVLLVDICSQITFLSARNKEYLERSNQFNEISSHLTTLHKK